MQNSEMSLFYTEETNDSYDSGNSRWYVVPETPMPVTQAVGSPVPPPRQRHNPFNKPETMPYQRSHSLRCVPGKSMRFKYSAVIDIVPL